MKKIGILMGSDSDLPVVQKAIDQLKELEVPFEVHIYSAHRTPEEAREFSVNARSNGFGAIIAAAGMAAHLAGAVAANTTLPVIGIPCKSKNFDGLDALLSTVQMPPGIPVATAPAVLAFVSSTTNTLAGVSRAPSASEKAISKKVASALGTVMRT